MPPARSPLTARRADKYELYERAVYDPEADFDFIQRHFRAARGRRALSLREDFAGTAKLSALWVERMAQGRAWAVDLDPEPLAWGRQRHFAPLGAAARRAKLLRTDVMHARTPQVDVVTAFNFSYWVFQERARMLAYFRRVFRTLRPEGAFFLDLMGGPGVQEETEEKRRAGGFTYVWEQETLDAITHRLKCHIHFRFADGTALRRAFSYDWRLWSVTELRDLLAEAGFAASEVYWEDADARGRGTGVFRRRVHAENETAWIAYLVGWKGPVAR